MTLAGKRISVAFPDTVLEEHDSLRDKTLKLGQIARAYSVFGVDTIQVFRDPRGRGESGVIRRVLEYLETPQYLRRRIFPLDETLKFAGLLPPLRIPSHKPKIRMQELRPGEYREGFALPDGRSVDVGLDKLLTLKHKATANRRMTVRVTSAEPLEGEIAEASQVGEYWGYSVEVKGVEDVLSDSRFNLKVATSRYGDQLAPSFQVLGERMKLSKGVMILFGSPSRGLFQLIKNVRQRVDLVVNLYPEQHTVTIRTEEALSSGLYLAELLLTLEQKTKV
jgi:methyltransferase